MNISVDNTTGDIELVNGELPLVSGVDEYAQFIGQKLKSFLGEWFLDVRLGVPYFDRIFEKQINPEIVTAIFRNEIITTPGVLELQELDLNLDAATRRLDVDFRALSTDGEVSFSEEIG